MSANVQLASSKQETRSVKALAPSSTLIMRTTGRLGLFSTSRKDTCCIRRDPTRPSETEYPGRPQMRLHPFTEAPVVVRNLVAGPLDSPGKNRRAGPHAPARPREREDRDGTYRYRPPTLLLCLHPQPPLTPSRYREHGHKQANSGQRRAATVGNSGRLSLLAPVVASGDESRRLDHRSTVSLPATTDPENSMAAAPGFRTVRMTNVAEPSVCSVRRPAYAATPRGLCTDTWRSWEFGVTSTSEETEYSFSIGFLRSTTAAMPLRSRSAAKRGPVKALFHSSRNEFGSHRICCAFFEGHLDPSRLPL